MTSQILKYLLMASTVLLLTACGALETADLDLEDSADSFKYITDVHNFGEQRKLGLKAVSVSAPEGEEYETSDKIEVSGVLVIDGQSLSFQFGGAAGPLTFTSYEPYVVIDGRCLEATQPYEPCDKLALSIMNIDANRNVTQSGVLLLRVTDIKKSNPRQVFYAVEASKEILDRPIPVEDLAWQLFEM